jgi:farnesyl-diphosphate farnesyltransferase
LSSEITVEQLRGPLLRAVSRTFYLSIRLLPVKLRDPIALAYLLARATDTIADTAEIDPKLRARELASLAARIQGENTTENSLLSFAALQKDEAEQQLIEELPACLIWLKRMPAADRADIRNVLLKINEGQSLDLQRFPNSAHLVALETSADLDRYTYLVAGSVGEFWTNICFRHLPDFASRDPGEMHSLGIEYGKGLQLINILRDVGADLRAGRCYLPAEEMHSLGVSAEELKAVPERVEIIMQRWLARAENGVAAGIEYSCAIKPWRVRLATALPALIGVKTLALMKQAGADAFTQRIKISRSDVRKVILSGVAHLASPAWLRRFLTENTSAASR